MPYKTVPNPLHHLLHIYCNNTILLVLKKNKHELLTYRKIDKCPFDLIQ